eukprot:Em0008g670a
MTSLLAFPLVLYLDQGEQCKDDEGACSAYLSDEGLVKTAGTCVGGRCRCGSATDGDWDPCTCLPIIGDCHIEKNSLNAVGVPMETAWAGPLYSCTPIGSSVNCRHEVHVISNHDAGPSSVVSVSLTMDGTSSSSKPVVLVLMNFKPIHWVLEIPDDVPVRQVVLTGQSPWGANVTYTRSEVETVSITKTSLLFGYGPDSGTPQALNYIQQCFGPIASFSGVFFSKGWTLNINRSQSNQDGCEVPSDTQYQPSDVQCATEIATPISLTPSSPPAIPLGTVRLTGGGVCSGQIQLFASCAKYPAQWLHLASGNFEVEEGKVACRQLGCPSGAVAITNTTTRTYGKYIETSLECNGSEDHLLSCTSSSNEACHSQDNSTVEVVILSCSNNLTGGDDGQQDATIGSAEITTSQSSQDAGIGQTKNSNGTYSDIHATQMVTTSLALISPTSTTYRSSTHRGANSATRMSAVNSPVSPTTARGSVYVSSTAVKNPRPTKVPTTEPPGYVSSYKQSTPSSTQPGNTTRLLDNLNAKKRPPTADGTASEEVSPASKYVAGCVMALILALMVFSAVGMSIYYHSKRRRERRERPETDPNEILSRSESVHTNARLFIADQRYAEDNASLGRSEPPPSYLSVAGAESPPPAYDTLVQLRPAIVLRASVQTVV